MRTFIFAFFFSYLSMISGQVMASTDGIHLDEVEVDLSDKASLQRGAKTFVNYCLSCHQASFMRYNRMAKDLDLSDAQVKENLMFASEKIGDTMTVAMRAEDAKKWFGVTPPDLSVISRSRGTAWLNTYLRTFYIDDTKATGTNNLVFKDTAMPHVLWKQQGYLHHDEETGHLTPASEGSLSSYDYNVMVADLVNFLAYVGEPSKIQRLELGKWVLLYLFLFFLVAYPMKKAFWRDIH
ncbi:MAG: cytochrome c1 [Pseudomonadota bacterium]|nr:cytochrome c1 [Pseudomonadota bacterium]MDO7710871.1 cytochrome c1 [Pseudomonadota bacterium]